MPFLNVEVVEDAFRFLVDEHGFSGPISKMVGTDFTIQYRCAEREISIYSMDMGSSFPYGNAIIYEGEEAEEIYRLFDLDELARLWEIRFVYPVTQDVNSMWFLKAIYMGWKLRAKRQEEYNKRVCDLASFVGDNMHRLWDMGNPRVV